MKDEGSKHTPFNDLFVYKEKKDQVLCTLFPSKIKYDGKCFISTKHCCQYQRAIFHKEDKLAFKELSDKLANKPKKVRRLMKIEDKKSWKRERYEVMKKIAVAKMEPVKEVRQCLEQNPICVIAQLGTDQDQHSLYWCSGLGRSDTDKTPMAKWPGINKIGQIWMELRNSFPGDASSTGEGILQHRSVESDGDGESWEASQQVEFHGDSQSAEALQQVEPTSDSPEASQQVELSGDIASPEVSRLVESSVVSGSPKASHEIKPSVQDVKKQGCIKSKT